ncbi:hypothetical protein TWF694_009257 [Orbilia ellipsospora]|uniref:Uncharacterized protein n=1 Tax=Orbilia ellipsospora TaxID=2528407 RepID=A0AAV9XEY3_9PEZI
MKLQVFAISSVILLTEVNALALPEPEPPTFDFTPEQWQSKWDAWRVSDASSLRKRLSKRRDIGGSAGNVTDLVTIADFNPGEVCGRFTGCIGSAAATAAGYAAVASVATVKFCGNQATAAATALSADNYKLAKAVAAYTVTNVAIPLVVNTVGYYISLSLQNDAPQSKDDSCGISQLPAISEQAGTATYGFCLQLQSITKDKAFSRVDFGTVDADSTSDDVGLDMKMRFFITTVKNKHATACSLLGVWLKERGVWVNENGMLLD